MCTIFTTGISHPVVKSSKNLVVPRNGFNPQFPFRVRCVSSPGEVGLEARYSRNAVGKRRSSEDVSPGGGGFSLPVEPQGQPFVNGWKW